MASSLGTAIGTGCTLASATVSSATVTLTGKTAGAAGNFITQFGTATLFNNFYAYITNTTKGQGPNYVNAITIIAAGSGYGPDTPITLTGGGGTGAVAVANTSLGNRGAVLPACIRCSSWLGYGNRSGHTERIQPGMFERVVAFGHHLYDHRGRFEWQSLDVRHLGDLHGHRHGQFANRHCHLERQHGLQFQRAERRAGNLHHDQPARRDRRSYRDLRRRRLEPRQRGIDQPGCHPGRNHAERNQRQSLV